MPVVAGVDGGATRTRVALLNQNGEIRGIGYGGPSNYNNVTLDTVSRHISEAFREAADQAGLPKSSVDGIFLGMAGVVSDPDRVAIRETVMELEVAPPDKIYVDHDIRIALAGGVGTGEGIALIVGTGSSCFGISASNESWRAGGWGYLLDDRGSGYDFGRRAMMMTVRDADGRGSQTALKPLVMEALDLDDIQKIMRKIYVEGLRGEGRPMTKEEIASLSSLVFQAADDGDSVARDIIDQGVNELTAMVTTIVGELRLEGTVQVVITGGLAESYPAYRESIQQSISAELPACTFVDQICPPVVGAALLALDGIGVKIEPNDVQGLKEQFGTDQM